MSPGFYIPPSSSIHKTPGRFVCEICVRRLPEEDREAAHFNTAADLWRHVEGTPGKPGCAERETETVREMSPSLRAPGLFDENYEGADLEWKRWVEAMEAKHGPGAWTHRSALRTSEGKS